MGLGPPVTPAGAGEPYAPAERRLVTNMENFLSLVCWMGLLFPGGDQNPKAPTMTTAEAGNHIGETATVCGKVASARVDKYGVAGHGRPIILALDKPEPNPAFLILTLPADAKPPQPDGTYLGKQVCATGKIEKGRVPQIIATRPSQVRIQSEEKKDEKK
jgi:hypothetical protein